MEKSLPTRLVMSESSPLAQLASIIALRGQIPPSASADTLLKIQNLRGILDSKAVTSARNGGDWRRGSGGAHGGGNSHSYYSSNNESRWKNNHASHRSHDISSNRHTQSNSPSGSISSNKHNVYTGPPMGRYVSRFKNTSELIEEKILNSIIRLKLNKFGPTTYTEIREFLFQILGQESVASEDGSSVRAEDGQVAEFVRDFMLMVFKKAAAEQIYCPLYAKLLAEIGSKHSVIFDEMNSLYKNYMEIFEEADVNTATSSADMAAFEKKNIEKKYRQGYSQFIADLTTLEILPLESLATTFKTLFTQVDKHSRTAERKPLVEEYVDCLLRMSRVLKENQSEFFHRARSALYKENKDVLSNLINIRDNTYVSLSPKSRFLLMDIENILLVP